LNILNVFPRPRRDAGWQPGAWLLAPFVAAVVLMLGGEMVQAAPPLEEIRQLVQEKALWQPSLGSLAVLTSEQWEAGLRKIDPYARYIPKSSLSPDSEPVPKLGIEIFSWQSRLWVRLEPGGPADLAGLPEIGALQAINTHTVSGGDLGAAVALIDVAVKQGPVFLTISRWLSGEGRTYEVHPFEFKPDSLTWKRAGKYTVIRLKGFTAHNTAPSFYALYKTLIRKNSRVVIDLRGCSGGDLFEAIEIAGMFVTAGRPLVNTYDRSGLVQRYFSSRRPKLSRPVWILMDRRTASAAEIFAAILQHYKLARLIGERSVGKFFSQTQFPLSDGGQLVLTTLAIRSPKGIFCQGKEGLKPDIYDPDISILNTTQLIDKYDQLCQ
jgi:carboxyl-terminal processing protease